MVHMVKVLQMLLPCLGSLYCTCLTSSAVNGFGMREELDLVRDEGEQAVQDLVLGRSCI